MKNTPTPAAPGRNDPCWCGSGKKFKKCHLPTGGALPGATPEPVHRPARSPAHRHHRPHSTLIKTKAQIEGIRRAGSLNREILDMLEQRIVAGVTTGQVDDWVREMTVARGAVPATLNYKGFPKSCCTSVNEVVCHGIPGAQELVSGDIVNVDVTSLLGGFFGDSSRMFMVGAVSREAQRLVGTTRECLELGIAQVRPGNFVGDIGHAIQTHAAAKGYAVVRDFVGHGTGVAFHEEPQIPHFGRAGGGPPLLPGMVFTIEPMINQGNWPVKVLADGWTAVTRDGLLSAQFEHTVLVTSDGVEILTA